MALNEIQQRIVLVVDRNSHGLSRNIPTPIRRELRQRCGFGCVICGLGFFDYEHFDPEFKDANKHDPEGMTLLCMQCNQKKRRGLLSQATVRNANNDPLCLRSGFTSEWFDFGDQPIEVNFSGFSFRNCRHLIEIEGVPILSVASPVKVGEPFLLSGLFADDTGATTLRISDNVWSAGADNWDVEWVGPLLTIRRGLGDVVLRLRLEPPQRMTIEKLDMAYAGVFLRGSGTKLGISYDGESWNNWIGGGAENCHVGISLMGRTR